jgi:hypothetical protein
MFRPRTIISLFILPALFFYACVRRITPPIRNGSSILVVEGSVTTDSIPYVIKLSYTGKFTNASTRIDPDQNFINDAKVVIKDDEGDSALCNLISPGTYQSIDPNFVGIVGRTYTLKIYLSNGKAYFSTPEKMQPVVPIDSVTVVYDSSYITDIRPTQIIVSVNTHDPPGIQNFYKWTTTGYLPRKSWGSSCIIGGAPCFTAFTCTCNAFCDVPFNNSQINILSDNLINGKEIIQPVDHSYLYSQGKHFIEIKQYSMTRDIYEFWEQYLEQTNRTGSILDPLPASLIGNIHDVADSNDVALGYFEVSAVSTKRVIIIPFFLQVYFLESVAAQYAPMGDCHSDFPNSLPDDTDPTGWNNAQTIEMR